MLADTALHIMGDRPDSAEDIFSSPAAAPPRVFPRLRKSELFRTAKGELIRVLLVRSFMLLIWLAVVAINFSLFAMPMMYVCDLYGSGRCAPYRVWDDYVDLRYSLELMSTETVLVRAFMLMPAPCTVVVAALVAVNLGQRIAGEKQRYKDDRVRRLLFATYPLRQMELVANSAMSTRVENEEASPSDVVVGYGGVPATYTRRESTSTRNGVTGDSHRSGHGATNENGDRWRADRRAAPRHEEEEEEEGGRVFEELLYDIPSEDYFYKRECNRLNVDRHIGVGILSVELVVVTFLAFENGFFFGYVQTITSANTNGLVLLRGPGAVLLVTVLVLVVVALICTVVPQLCGLSLFRRPTFPTDRTQELLEEVRRETEERKNRQLQVDQERRRIAEGLHDETRIRIGVPFLPSDPSEAMAATGRSPPRSVFPPYSLPLPPNATAEQLAEYFRSSGRIPIAPPLYGGLASTAGQAGPFMAPPPPPQLSTPAAAGSAPSAPLQPSESLKRMLPFTSLPTRPESAFMSVPGGSDAAQWPCSAPSGGAPAAAPPGFPEAYSVPPPNDGGADGPAVAQDGGPSMQTSQAPPWGAAYYYYYYPQGPRQYIPLMQPLPPGACLPAPLPPAPSPTPLAAPPPLSSSTPSSPQADPVDVNEAKPGPAPPPSPLPHTVAPPARSVPVPVTVEREELPSVHSGGEDEKAVTAAHDAQQSLKATEEEDGATAVDENGGEAKRESIR